MSRGARILWLKIASATVIVTGLVSALASFDATAEPWRLLFDLLSWPIDGQPAGFDRDGRALSAVLGGVMAGWGWMLYRLVSGQLASGSRDVLRIMRDGLLVWFVVDSTGSLAAGLPWNVALNVGFLAAFAAPMVRWPDH